MTKWELIGIALGFDPEDLKIIEQTPTLISQGPVTYFKEMLLQWLKWAPPNHNLPTISSLCSALRSPNVGNEKIAKDLKEAIITQRGITMTTTMIVMAFNHCMCCVFQVELVNCSWTRVISQ